MQTIREIVMQQANKDPKVLIDGMWGEYRFLSNFHLAPVTYDGEVYPSTEHAYQAAKTLDLGKREEIRKADTCSKARRLGQLVPYRPDWPSIQIEVMEDLVWQKFHNHQELKELLLKTIPAELVEGNWWGDTFWGVYTPEMKGQNHLGRILMKIREVLLLCPT